MRLAGNGLGDGGYKKKRTNLINTFAAAPKPGPERKAATASEHKHVPPAAAATSADAGKDLLLDINAFLSRGPQFGKSACLLFRTVR